jgi:hypothetical protein
MRLYKDRHERCRKPLTIYKYQKAPLTLRRAFLIIAMM